MCIVQIMERFPGEAECFRFLEDIRYKDGEFCPFCASTHVARKRENQRIGRWNCHDCYSSFRVTHGTLFHKSKVPLQTWFLAITLMFNAKKSISSHQLGRDLGLNHKTTWYIQARIRRAMESEDRAILTGIVEADETYVGGKPRKGNKRDDDHKPTGPGGTKKVPVIGLIERDGKLIAKMVRSVTTNRIKEFIFMNVDTKRSTLMTDESGVYQFVDGYMKHKSVNHSVQYVDGNIHTNTLEGFWSLLKRAWHGTHHHYSKRFMPLYVAEACYKYNHRNTPELFDVFIRGCFA